MLHDIVEHKEFVNHQDGRLMINFEEQLVEFHPDFKLFFTTKKSSKRLSSYNFMNLSIINFTVTDKGLEEQLLSEIVMLEMPEIEKRRKENIRSISKFKQMMDSIEEKVVQLLGKSTSNPVEDEHLVNTLENS